MESAIIFDYTPEFLKAAKTLSKRYRSFKDDVKALCEEITKKPDLGDDLGNGVRKLRMAIKSKGKGKRGGARVISFMVAMDIDKDTNSKVTLLYVYDKSDMENVSENKIRQIISDNFLRQ
ncbi:MAG: type II toxin-antitoxin system RelE/ParE family toxin [Muribaculaceae bacterium]|nr:type II toxin-antitoxin system RelE/ParE family toxin [Muribaculaceae bacterium]